MLGTNIIKRDLIVILFIYFTSAVSAQDSLKTQALDKQAFEYIQSGNFYGAIKVHLKILSIDPDNYRSANEIAGLHGLLGQFADEITWARKALAINPNYALAYISLGNGLGASGDKEGALRYYQEAAKVDPENPFAPYCIGVLEENEGNAKTAISYYKAAVIIDPSFEKTYCGLATCSAALKEFADAEKYIHEALLLNPKSDRAIEIQKNIQEQMAHP